MRKIAFSVGELSADEHAARLIRAVKNLNPDLEMAGMGGRNMRAEGVRTIIDSETHGALMGFTEVLLAARKVFEVWRSMKRFLAEWRPDALVLIDYADFNLRLARVAHELGIKVFYYITPQVWAWRAGRVAQFEKYVDLAAVIFPFERPFFEDHGFARAVYVGHPFVDELSRFSDPEAESGYRNLFLLSQDLDPHRTTVALFPGSRLREIENHLAPLFQAAQKFLAEHQHSQALLAVAPSVERQVSSAIGRPHPRMRIVANRSLDILRCADVGLLKSGTSNLQAAFYGLPFSMFFKGNRLAEFIVTRFVRLEEYSIVNVIEPGTVRELIQRDVNGARLGAEISELVENSERRSAVKEKLKQVVQALGSCDRNPAFIARHSHAERTARLLLSLD